MNPMSRTDSHVQATVQRQGRELRGRLMVPITYTACSGGDLRVQLQLVADDSGSIGSGTHQIRISRLVEEREEDVAANEAATLSRRRPTTAKLAVVATLNIYPDPFSNVTQIVIPHRHFKGGGGGLYELEVVQAMTNNNSSSSNSSNDGIRGWDAARPADERLKQQLDVRWPVAKLSVTPESIGTYPEQPVTVIVEFPTAHQCSGNGVYFGRNKTKNNNNSNRKNKMANADLMTTTPTTLSTANSQDRRHRGDDEDGDAVSDDDDDNDLVEFWLELFYCGHEVYCDVHNVTRSQTLYAELLRGFPVKRVIQLRCELFGLAGHYVLKLRTANYSSSFIAPTAFIKVKYCYGGGGCTSDTRGFVPSSGDKT